MKLSKIFKDKTTLSFMAVVLGLGAILLMRQLSGKKPESVKLFDKLDKVCISDYCLVNQERGWMLDDRETVLPANRDNVVKLIDVLSTINLDEVVSVNKDRFADYGIGDSSPMLIRVDGTEIEVGNMSTDYASTFMRYGESVYKIDGVINKTTMSAKDYWLKTTIVEADSSQWKKIEIVSKRRKVEIDKVESTWSNQQWTNIFFGMKGKLATGVDLNKVTFSREINLVNESESSKFKVGEIGTYRNKKYFVLDGDGFLYEIDKKIFDSLTRLG